MLGRWKYENQDDRRERERETMAMSMAEAVMTWHNRVCVGWNRGSTVTLRRVSVYVLICVWNMWRTGACGVTEFQGFSKVFDSF